MNNNVSFTARRTTFSRGYAALYSGHLPIFQSLLILLVECQPFYFLSGSEPEGAAWALHRGVHGCPSKLCHPK
jgi:hypothetical protein